MDPVLNAIEAELLAEERRHLRALQETLRALGAAPADLMQLEASLRQLDELFLLVVVGEFNSGKSSLINALLGRLLLAEGATPTTEKLHLLRFGEVEERTARGAALEEIAAPIELLRQLRIVDTPGTNALDQRHEALTEEFAPRADLVLFVTSADRPFSESERQFMERIRAWGKKLVLVVNKIDILESAEDRERVRQYVEEHARRILERSPQVFMLSTRRALATRREEIPSDDAGATGFDALERYLAERLDETERVRLKLLNPLGVGLHLVARSSATVDEERQLLTEDDRAIEAIERQLALYTEDQGREFRFRLGDVDNSLHEFELRGNAFFDDTLRLARLPDLLNRARLETDFRRRVVAEAPREIESKVDAIIDWMVASEMRQWRAVCESLDSRQRSPAGERAGPLGALEHDRGRLLDTVGRAARRTLDGYDHEAEARRMASAVQNAVAGTALLEVGALGLGAVVTALATTQIADFTGVLAASTLAVIGLFVIPHRRRAAKRQLAARIAGLRRQLMEALTAQFDRELEASVRRVREALAPYTRFVRAERQRLEVIADELATARERLETLRARIEAATGAAPPP